MQKLLIHINFLFALIFLISAGSAFGQSSTSTTPKTTTQLDSYISVETEQYAVDLGLNVYWADRNVGATDYQDVGSYFNWSQASTWNNTSSTATPKWDGYWRTPTKEEFNDLVKNTSNAGHPNNFRCTFTNISNSTLSIILTSTGYEGCIGLSEKTMGYYWTSSNWNVLRSYRFKFDCCTWYPNDKWYVSYGFVIRPVIDKCSNVVINAQHPGNTNESTVASSQSYPKGSTLHAETVECYHYQWYKNGSPVAGGYNNDIEVTESNATYKVVYFKKVHEITTDTYPTNNEYGTATIDNSTANNKYESCTSIQLKADPKDSCYYFVKWVEKKNGTTKDITPSDNKGYSCTTKDGVNTLEVAVDTTATYTAYFKQYKYSVTASSNNTIGTAAITKNKTSNDIYNCGTKLTLTADPKDSCYYFEKWMETKNGTAKEISPSNNQDYTCSTTGGVNTLEVEVDASATYMAYFKQYSRTLTVTCSPTEGGAIYFDNNPITSIQVACGDVVTIEARAYSCYYFDGWSDDVATASRVVTVNSDLTLTAKFKQKESTITVTKTGEGKVANTTTPDGSNGKFKCGTPVTVTAEPDDCYDFVKWIIYQDGTKSGEIFAKDNSITESDGVYSLTVTTPSYDVTYEAVFERKETTITVGPALSDGEGGEASIQPNTNGEVLSKFGCDTTITLIATPAECYRFVRWIQTIGSDTVHIKPYRILGHATSCSTGIDGKNTLKIVVPSNVESINYQAEFERITYTITTNTNNDDWGEVFGGGRTYYCGDTIKLTARPKDCYQFDKWSDGVKDSVRTIVVDGDINLIANFSKKTYLVTTNSNDTTLGRVSPDSTSVSCGDSVVLIAAPNNSCMKFKGWYANGDLETQVYDTIHSDDGFYKSVKDKNGNYKLTIYNVADTLRLVAVFKKKTFSFTASVNNTNYGKISGTDNGTYDCGAEVTISATANLCYTFTGWSDGVMTAERTIMLDKDTAIVANFSSATYSVELRTDALGGGHVEGPSTSGCGFITITAVPDSCYRFLRWENGETNPERIVNISSDTSFTASFEPIQYSITTKVNIAEYGNAKASPETVTCAQDAKVTLTATPANTCYYLKEWIKVGSPDSTRYYTNHQGADYTCNTDADGVNTLIVPVTDDAEYIAIFALDAFEVNATCDASQGSISIEGDYTCGNNVTLEVTPQECFQFVQWRDTVSDTIYTADDSRCSTTDGRSYTLTLPVTGDAYYVATFEKRKVTVTLIAEEGGSVIGGGDFYCNTTITLKARPEECYHFVKWSDNITDTVRTYRVEGNDTLRAYFARDTFAIQVQGSEGGNATGSGNYACGDTATLTATADECYQFQEWSDGNTDNPRKVEVKKDSSFTAVFEKNNYTLTVSVKDNIGGSVSGSGEYACGDTATLTATADECYRFVNWSDGNMDNPRMVEVKKDSSFTAVFAKNNYTLTVSVKDNIGGTVTGSGSYACGDTATLTTTADECYQFQKWTDGNTDNPRKVEVKKDSSFTAVFEKNNYTLTTSVQNGIGGSVSGSGEYACGDTATLTATAVECYQFQKWTDGNTDNPRLVVVTEDKQYEAKFEIIKYTISIDPDDPKKGSTVFVTNPNQ